MIFTTKTFTNAYIWNTRLEIELEIGVYLSNYTELEEEFDEITLAGTYERVCLENEVDMKSPCLMMVVSGFHKSCRVWIDKSLLNVLPELHDPKKGFEYYSEQ